MVTPDPIRARRRQMAKMADLGKRIGYGFLAFACVTFLVAVVAGLPKALVTLVVADLIVASVLLLPAIVVGYGVKKAEREDPKRP
jgi:Flp pilus assembly protein TadB